jgi:hypothetical protein
MSPLPQPDDLTSLVLRTDFTNDAAREAIKTAVDSYDDHHHATYVSDPAYADADVHALVEIDSAASDDEKVTYLFMADAASMADPDQRLLAIDLYTEPGRTFRVRPAQFRDISANLCIANINFDEFADHVDDGGTYRGFGG